MPPGPSDATPRAPVVAVVGPGEASREEAAAARAIGRQLAASGLTVICGGLGGVMAAACKGARESGIQVASDPADAVRRALAAVGVTP